MQAIFKLHPDLKSVNMYEGLADEPELSIEGGDVIVVDEQTVLVGSGQVGRGNIAIYLYI